MPNNTSVVIPWGSETYDTDAFHSTSTNTERLTVPSGKSGYYLISAQVTWSTNSTGYRISGIYKNDTLVFEHYARGVSDIQTMGFPSGVVYATAGDYFTVKMVQNSGDDRYLQASAGAGATLNKFQMNFLGA